MDDKTNKLYEDFKTSDVLDGITADNFDSLKNQAFITPQNKEFFEDMLRVGWLSGQISSSGPIEVKYVELELGGGDDDPTIFFQPSPGQIWQLNWGQWQGDGSSNFLYQGIDSTGARPSFGNGGTIFFSSATNGKFCTDNSAEIAGGARIFVSNSTPLLAQTYNDTTGAYWAAWFTRVR